VCSFQHSNHSLKLFKKQKEGYGWLFLKEREEVKKLSNSLKNMKNKHTETSQALVAHA
jgi:hypothetical protein